MAVCLSACLSFKTFFGDNSVSLRQIWTKLVRNSSYKPPGASKTAQGPHKQPGILKQQFIWNNRKYKTSLYIHYEVLFWAVCLSVCQSVRQSLPYVLRFKNIFSASDGRASACREPNFSKRISLHVLYMFERTSWDILKKPGWEAQQTFWEAQNRTRQEPETFEHNVWWASKLKKPSWEANKTYCERQARQFKSRA